MDLITEMTYGTGAKIVFNVTVTDNLTNTSVSSNMTTTAATNSKKELIISLYFWIFGVVVCCLSIVGVMTNLLNIYALSKTVRTNRRPMYHCLICMAVVDMLLMCILLARSARLYLVSSPLVIPQSVYDPEKGILVDYPTYIFYNIWYIPADICITMSNWCTVTMGLFRLVAVFAPLRAASLCTVRRAQMALVIVCLFSLIINLPLILEKRIVDGKFVLNDDYSKYNTIPVMLTVPVPIITVLVINTLLLFRIRFYRKQVNKLFEGQNDSIAKTNSSKERGEQRRESASQTRQAERILIAVSMFYVITSIPNVAYWVADYWQLMKNIEPVSLHVFYLVANLFIYINHACNFLFYVLLNKPFRKLLWRKLSHKALTKGGDSQGPVTTNSFSIRGESMKLKRQGSAPTVRSRLLGGEKCNNNNNLNGEEKPYSV